MEELLNILKIVLFGIIEGITEWLPISSTGHMILLEEFLGVQDIFDGGKAFWDFFLVAIQLGAILAVVACFFNKLNPFWGKSLQEPTREKSKEEKKKYLAIMGKGIRSLSSCSCYRNYCRRLVRFCILQFYYGFYYFNFIWCIIYCDGAME